ncbi:MULTISPECIES: hemerythrin domain-containing protein [Streptomyces]|uniref:hemerythrin domain-containing protein n=1 Tax=Streptomyces TaxID=1883 RepID=UPI001E3496D1|nr:hemerythrin domain-containing protein [Streptomyces canarius]
MAHAALRREFRLLPQLVRDVVPGDATRAAVVGAHADLVCRVLHTHHEGEDALLWPKLLDRGGEELVRRAHDGDAAPVHRPVPLRGVRTPA